jgi:hypothetical protein
MEPRWDNPIAEHAQPTVIDELPNNLGPSLLIIGGSFLVPLLLGRPLLLVGLGQLRRADGSRAFADWPIQLP